VPAAAYGDGPVAVRRIAPRLRPGAMLGLEKKY